MSLPVGQLIICVLCQLLLATVYVLTVKNNDLFDKRPKTTSVLGSDVMVRSTRGTRQHHVFTTSLEGSAGWSITAKSLSITTH